MMTNEQEKITNTNGVEVYKGRWGYYPCSYETFLKLKELNKAALKAKRQAKAWFRWSRKMEHNRPAKEPEINKLFTKLVESGSSKTHYANTSTPMRWLKDDSGYVYPAVGRYEWTDKDKWYPSFAGYNHSQEIVVNLHNIPNLYRHARIPRESPDSVVPLDIPIGKIEAMHRDISE